MFLGRILVGRIFLGDKSTRRPPKDLGHPQEKPFHSAVNSVTDPSLYVVFDRSQCYPEYLIEYRKV